MPKQEIFQISARDWIVIILWGGAAIAFTQMVWQLLLLRRILLQSVEIRRVGRVRITISNHSEIPFSFWSFRWAYVVVPSRLISAATLSLILRHEIQHHRQRDTLWIYLSEACRLLFFWNPFCLSLLSRVVELQEIACDDAILGRKRVSPQAYSRCLIQVAETALASCGSPAGTAGLASRSGHFLKRRIEKMLDDKRRYLTWPMGMGAGFLVFSFLVTAAVASRGLIQDKRLSLGEAKRLVQRTKRADTFPLTLNEPVLKELNRFIGTPDGRDFMRSSLRRLEEFRPVVEKKLKQYSLPYELIAIPITESGYKNLPASKNPLYAAGLWQFTPEAAHRYGLLAIDPRRPPTAQGEDRLNVELSTDAALRYLGALNLRFQNWELAVLAYNAGEKKVQDGIDATGSKNAWTLMEKGFSGDVQYLSRVVAAIVIMENPDLVS